MHRLDFKPGFITREEHLSFDRIAGDLTLIVRSVSTCSPSLIRKLTM
jgi:hypothetical protein